MKKTILTLSAAAILFAACNSSSNNEAPAAEAPAATEAPAETPAVDANVAEVTLNGDDAMKFDLSEIKVKEGQTVKLTLNHIGTAPKAAMGHNFVLLAQGADMEKFATEAINAAATDYIPASLAKEVLAHTSTIGGGESTTVEFKAPAKGSYDFFCSFPGHHATMKGKFIVE